MGHGTDEIIDEFQEKLGMSVEEAMARIHTWYDMGGYMFNPGFNTNLDISQEVNQQGIYDSEYADLLDSVLDMAVNNDEDDGIYGIGCDFGGGVIIKEFEDEHMYIPNSYHCAIKCVEKAMNLQI